MNSIIILISIFTLAYLSIPFMGREKGRRYTLELTIDNSGHLFWRLMNIYSNQYELEFVTPLTRNVKFEKNSVICDKQVFLQSVILKDSQIAYSISIFEDDDCIYSENCYVTLKDPWGMNMLNQL